MRTVIARLIFCNEVVQRTQHIRLETVIVVLDGIGEDSALEVHQMGEIEVEGGEVELAQAVYLCNVVFVGGDCAGCWACRRRGIFGEAVCC